MVCSADGPLADRRSTWCKVLCDAELRWLCIRCTHPTRGAESMSAYRRWFVPGGTYFFTVVTYNRYPFFRDPSAVDMLRDSWLKTQANLTFTNIASVVLPDHFHCLWSLPPNDDDFSKRLKSIKDRFTMTWLASGGHEEAVSESARSRGCRGIWQPRFWEHVIRDEDDLENHFDYIHFNPVKHGYVTHPSQWPHSTYHRYVSSGHYSSHWGHQCPKHIETLELE